MSASTPKVPEGHPGRPAPSLRTFPPQPRLSDRVAAEIVRTIVEHDLKPGDALPPERELGAQFGVSRTVVREAVRALDARGILEVRVGSRIKVAAVEPETVRDAIWHFGRTTALDRSSITAVSVALDLAAARAAAEHATETDLELIAGSASATDGGDPARDELAFRRAVVAASHNELLIVLAEAVVGLLTGHHSTGGAPERRAAVSAAIADRDPDRAERTMRELCGRPAPGDTERD